MKLNVHASDAAIHTTPNLVEKCIPILKLLEDLSQPLYEGTSISKLAATVKLLNTKSLGKWSNKSFSMLV
jgi:hypothetical protein